MKEGIQKDMVVGVIAGTIITVILDLAIPFAGPLVGGFTAGYLAKGDVGNAAKAGVLTGFFAAFFVSIGYYFKLMHSQAEGFVAGWATGLTLYLVFGLYFIAMAFLGAVLTSAIRK
jgi:hypothetical protein